MSVKIVTNNQRRDILYWQELTDDERSEHDYLKTSPDQESATFVRYRGYCYYLGDFMRIADDFSPVMKRWHGYHSDSYFSGIVVRFVDDHERVVVGHYYS